MIMITRQGAEIDVIIIFSPSACKTVIQEAQSKTGATVWGERQTNLENALST